MFSCSVTLVTWLVVFARLFSRFFNARVECLNLLRPRRCQIGQSRSDTSLTSGLNLNPKTQIIVNANKVNKKPKNVRYDMRIVDSTEKSPQNLRRNSNFTNESEIQRIVMFVSISWKFTPIPRGIKSPSAQPGSTSKTAFRFSLQAFRSLALLPRTQQQPTRNGFYENSVIIISALSAVSLYH